MPAPRTRTRTPAARPTWCGACDEFSRLVDLESGYAAHCPRCHPTRAAVTPRPATRPVQVSFIELSAGTDG